MNTRLRNFGAAVLHSVGVYSLRRRVDARRGRRLLVLMYHDIQPDDMRYSPLDDGSPGATEFAAHVDAAASRFRVVTLADAAREMRAGGLREDSVAFTFDDGYAAVHEQALPELKRRGVPSTLFVLTGWIEGMTFWWHRLRGMISAARLEALASEEVERALGISLPRLNGNRGDAFRSCLARAAEDRLRDIRDEERNAIMDALSRCICSDGAPPATISGPLSWAQINDLTRHGVEIAAHTHTHPNLRYAEADAVREDIVRSRDLIVQHTGQPVVGFAYPYGKDLDHYRAYDSVLRDHGFEYACTAAPGNNRGNAVGMYSLRRISAPSTRSRSLIDRALCLAFVRDNSFYDMRSS